MDNQRLILFMALAFVLFLSWEAWQKDYGPQPAVDTQAQQVPDETAPAKEAPADIPTAHQSETAKSQTETPQAPVAKAKSEKEAGRRIQVKTDTFKLVIGTRGGDLLEADLPQYPVSIEQPDEPYRLLRDTMPNLFVAQTGLLSKQGAPDHYALFKAQQTDYSLMPGQGELRVPLTWQDDKGIKVTKTLVFHRGSYVIDVQQTVENGSSQPWQGSQYRQLQSSPFDSGKSSAFVHTYNGGVIYSEEEKYEKIKFKEMADNNLSREIKGGWEAIVQHYFLGAIVPPKDQYNHFYSKAPGDDRYVLGMVSPGKTIQPGQSGSFTTRFYVGPKEQNILKNVAEGLDLTVDYGILTVIAKPVFWALGWFHDLVGNWGWAIILVTLIIKLIFFPLSAASYRSMANMRKFSPKIQQLKERYGDDRQRMSQAMMELYKKEKINPLGGCLPMIVQIPVFISLYWVLLESVELRQAPFIFWIHDLSIRDPYYVLPLLMGISMFAQQKLNPPPPDPVQAKVMMALPIVFSLFFAFFPAGLVLYWLANSVLSVLQQWYITSKIEKAAGNKK